MIIQELQEVSKKYGQPRITEIIYQAVDAEPEEEAEEVTEAETAAPQPEEIPAPADPEPAEEPACTGEGEKKEP